ncbi:unnamed protein product [Parascedosporium putredinis]|uniref:Uncharacterized protein n=1 Tax=Parascedosporium putredinis TaxID=1442378 RepID=A0A9P1H751_9PEZI|nr:unnamed protein product [Parascedosporium putredinis]CAI7999518.1 unnamed protein product [Parascedosporium putredinis]
MRVYALFSALCAATLASAELAKVYIQPITASSENQAPTFLADVQYHLADTSVSEVVNYEFPEIPEDAENVRVGLYDSAAQAWTSSSSLQSITLAKVTRRPSSSPSTRQAAPSA